MTEKEAKRLRGLIQFALECADDNAHAGAQDPHTAYHVREQFALAKKNVWAEIKLLTEKDPK